MFSKVSDEDEEMISEAEVKEEINKLRYKKVARHYIGDAIRNANCKVKLTAAQYHKGTKMLVTGKKNIIINIMRLLLSLILYITISFKINTYDRNL